MKVLKYLLIVLILSGCVPNIFESKLTINQSSPKSVSLSFMIDYLQNCPETYKDYIYISSSLIALNKVCYYG
jgi:hypothetical protein